MTEETPLVTGFPVVPAFPVVAAPVVAVQSVSRSQKNIDKGIETWGGNKVLLELPLLEYHMFCCIYGEVSCEIPLCW